MAFNKTTYLINKIVTRMPHLCHLKKCPYKAYIFLYQNGYGWSRSITVTGYCLLHKKRISHVNQTKDMIIFSSRKELENILLLKEILEE